MLWLRLVTVAAIHRSILARLKRHLYLITTVGTDCYVHLAGLAFVIAPAPSPTTISAIRLLACSPARGTTTRRIRQSSARIKFLLANGEDEFRITVATIQGLVGQCHVSFSIPGFQTPSTTVYRAAYNRQSTLSNNAPYNVPLV